MPSVHNSIRGNVNYGLGASASGFTEIVVALRRIESGLSPELRKRLKTVGEHVAESARGNVEHKTGQHHGHPALAAGIKVSVTQKSALVYSSSPHGGVQNVGGNVGHRKGPHVNRANASHYMDRAVEEDREWVQVELDKLLDWLVAEFAK